MASAVPSTAPASLPGKKSKGDRGEACADQGNDLGEKQVPVGSICKRLKHGQVQKDGRKKISQRRPFAGRGR
jgi:hypothetical protein